MAEEEQDKSEHASQFKLEEARKRGNVAKSQDVLTLGAMVALVAYLYWAGWPAVQKQLAHDVFILRHAGSLSFEPSQAMHWLQELFVQSLILMAPFFLLVVIVAIASSMFQTGPVFSFKPMSPDFTRLNPMQGLKRVFSMRTVYDTVRSLAKVTLFGAVLGLVIWHLMPRLVGLLGMEPKAYAHPMLDEIAALLFKLVLAMMVIALLDLMYTRWEYAKRMRMSRREMKDEHKQREGDPRIRARLRQLRLEMLKKAQAMRKLPGADVLVTNPTHFAVAISYKDGAMPAPQVVAKGAGDLAARMRQVAARHAIPIVQNPALARELYFKVNNDAYVPERLYPSVARILVWVYAMRESRMRAQAAGQ